MFTIQVYLFCIVIWLLPLLCIRHYPNSLSSQPLSLFWGQFPGPHEEVSTCSICSVTSEDPLARADQCCVRLFCQSRSGYLAFALPLAGRDPTQCCLSFHVMEFHDHLSCLSHIQDCLEVDSYHSPHALILRTSFNNQGPVSCAGLPLP